MQLYDEKCPDPGPIPYDCCLTFEFNDAEKKNGKKHQTAIELRFDVKFVCLFFFLFKRMIAFFLKVKYIKRIFLRNMYNDRNEQDKRNRKLSCIIFDLNTCHIYTRKKLDLTTFTNYVKRFRF